MLDLDAAIRERLASWGDDPCGYATCIVIGYAEMRAALLAVIDLHQDIDGFGDQGRYCAHCGPRETWPCPTKRAIATVLGVAAAQCPVDGYGGILASLGNSPLENAARDITETLLRPAPYSPLRNRFQASAADGVEVPGA